MQRAIQELRESGSRKNASSLRDSASLVTVGEGLVDGGEKRDSRRYSVRINASRQKVKWDEHTVRGVVRFQCRGEGERERDGERDGRGGGGGERTEVGDK